MLGRHYNNSISIINPRTKNRIANSRSINYIEKIAINKDVVITKEDYVTAENPTVKNCATCAAKQDASLISILSRNDNNYKRDFGSKVSLPRKG